MLFVQRGALLKQPETLDNNLRVVCEGTDPIAWEPRDDFFAPESLVRCPPLADIRKSLALLARKSRIRIPQPDGLHRNDLDHAHWRAGGVEHCLMLSDL